MSRILIVEDELVIRTALKRLLERHNYQVTETDSVSQAQQHNLDEFELIISDLRLPGAPGTDMIKLAGETPVLIMTSFASLRTAVDSMKMGAVDYIAKPFDHDEMLATVEHILSKYKKHQQLEQTSHTKKPAENKIEGIIGHCPAMLTLFERIKKVAPTDATVLINGETGTGKELVAKAIHSNSQRAHANMICVNCAAIPETLIESELFGYEKGAFTGANTSRVGLIEAADGGTLFLDEIGELPLEAQARLLRFIQEGEIRRIGSVHALKVDVRLITATHRDLKKFSQSGEFRQDLYYRINVMRLELPPLRQRNKDIIDIADMLLEKTCAKLGTETKHFSAKAIQALTTYNWPGNIRELENIVERACILSDEIEISCKLLDIDLELVDVSELNDDNHQSNNSTTKTVEGATEEGLSLEDYFQRFILEHQDTMSETELARKLGVSRKSLWERRKRLGIPRSKGKDESD